MIIRIKKHNYVTYNATKGKTNGKRKVSIEYKWLVDPGLFIYLFFIFYYFLI